jgi:hypothetical protein
VNGRGAYLIGGLFTNTDLKKKKHIGELLISVFIVIVAGSQTLHNLPKFQ